uniref:Reverse transcriptase domain-containing protein n=1 Tax=Aegilops tauschii subsp. strangulata TaxID=200361 RepID=A0A453ILA3_AEGTS
DLQCSLTARYELTLSKINQYYKQRSKKNWVSKGDRNTKFFHQAVIKRRKRNTICSIKDEHDLIHCNPTAFMQTFVNYFNYIFSSPNENVFPSFPLHQRYNHNNDPTYSIPDNAEILQILKDMKLNASPGPDGFNVEFYLATWDWIGEEVTHLVTNFYQTTTLPSHINNTNIALIPKKLVPYFLLIIG